MKIFPVFIPHFGCPFRCIYCNQKFITKIEEPFFDDIKNRIENFCKNNSGIEKEIAFFGGTFTRLSKDEQRKCFELIKPFETEISGIRISTRPDSINNEILTFCKENNIKTIELGIQSFDDDVLTASHRGYDAKTALKSCELIKSYKFNLGVQLMPGLPKFSANSLKNTINSTIDAAPHFVRIYPTIVLSGTELENIFKSGKYLPLTMEEAIRTTSQMIQRFEEKNIKIIKVGLHSDIEEKYIVAGPYHHAFGELVRAEILKNKILKDFEDKTLMISSSDVSLFKGFNSKMLNDLKQRTKLKNIPIKISSKLEKNRFLFTDKQPDYIW